MAPWTTGKRVTHIVVDRFQPITFYGAAVLVRISVKTYHCSTIRDESLFFLLEFMH
jgi:hypothetical protein